MVKAELSYNPYLMEINVKFNGQPPRINSLIEKYQNKPLQDWIDIIPSIFFDEMNGFDFELDFSGTLLDYNEVKSAFTKANVSEDQVTVFLRNELESRESKTEAINDLLNWLNEHPNRKFEYDTFRQDNQDVFDDNYTYIVLHGNYENDEYEEVSIETVDSVDELERTNLTHTPIMFYISSETINSISEDLKKILNRNDIDQKQLFFFISRELQCGKVKRTIIDLGIKEPNIVKELFDEKVNTYFLLYPISDYIHNAINAFRTESGRISSILDVENAKCESEGHEIHMRLDSIEGMLKALKNADETIRQRDNLEFPQEFYSIRDGFIKCISEWKNKKTKITKVDEARDIAAEFNTYIHRIYGEFCTQIDGAFFRYADDIKETYSEWCSEALEIESGIDDVSISNSDYPIIAEQTINLLNLKEEKYVVPETNFIGRFFKSSDSTAEKTPVLETTYYYHVWREHMVNIALPAANQLISIRFEILKKYYDELAVSYHDKLTKLIEVKTAEKDEVSSKLSDEERLLQIDNDWLSEFVDQIKSIERS